jgi:nucleotide-binding universal stress UspA family protein
MAFMADQRQTILTSLALSPRAAAVAAEGLQLASILSAQALFVHVGENTPAVREKLRQVLRPLPGGEAVTDEAVLIRGGHPGRAICAAAAETGAQIVVMGALDRDPPLVRVWGSVARHVARRAPCSVMLLPDPQSPHAAVRRIVASLPLNAESAEMVPLVLQLARGLPGTLVSFVHEFSVAEVEWAGNRSLGAGEQRGPAEAEVYVRERLRIEQELLADFLSGFDLSGVSVHLEVLPGHEGVEAVDYARRTNADLLAIPARARRLTIWDRVFHHPLELALRELPCGLLLFRPATARSASARVKRP